MPLLRSATVATFSLLASLVSASAQTPLPEAIAAPGETVMLTLHAEGAQVYECKAGAEGTLAWVFREPIATLFSAARRSAGIMPDRTGSTATAARWSARSSAPPQGRSRMDIPWLKLGVASRRGNGVLSPATTVQRINTVGGKLNGACYKAGTYESVPYSADYVFLRKG